MLCDAAKSVGGTDARTVGTRILTFLLITCLVLIAVGIIFAFGLFNQRDNGSDLALDEWITGIARWTRADRVVADHLTPGVDTARSCTRIAAVGSDTGQTVGTVRIGGAFRFTADVRISFETGQTDAERSLVLRLTFGVGAARIGIADIDSIDTIRYHDVDWSGRTEREGIPTESLSANADWCVIGHAALGVGTAGIDARIFAAVTHAALFS